MTFSETFKPMTPLKDTGTCHFDYPEVFVLILTVVLRAIYYDFRSISMALLVIITLPSLMILIYNYRRQTSFWTSNIVIILLSVVIGSLQFCMIIFGIELYSCFRVYDRTFWMEKYIEFLKGLCAFSVIKLTHVS